LTNFEIYAIIRDGKIEIQKGGSKAMRRWVRVKLEGRRKKAMITLETSVDEYDYLSDFQIEKAKEAIKEVIEGVGLTSGKEGYLRVYYYEVNDGKVTRETKEMEIWVKRIKKGIYDLRQVTYSQTGMYWSTVEGLVDWMIEKFRNYLEPEIQKVVRIA